MPELKPRVDVGESSARNTDFEIVVEESTRFAWPLEDMREDFGEPMKRIRFYFKPFLNMIRSIRKDYSWKVFYIDPATDRSMVEQFPEVVDQLEKLFERELGTKYSHAQRELLLCSHIVIIAVAKKSNEIAGYFSASYAPRNSIPGIPIPVTFGNHGVIAEEHQQFKIGVTMGALSILHGQKLRDLFRTIACVLRTNNKNILNPLRQAGNVYRSDHLQSSTLSKDEAISQRAIDYMHNNVFNLPDEPLPWDKPLEIDHRFDPAFTIDGVRENQIIYISCVTSLSKCTVRLFARRRRRKRQHAS